MFGHGTGGGVVPVTSGADKALHTEIERKETLRLSYWLLLKFISRIVKRFKI